MVHGSLETVQQSLESGASIVKCDLEIPWQPMALTVETGCEDIVRYLLEQGTGIRHTRSWLNPRHEDYCKCRGSLLLLAARGIRRWYPYSKADTRRVSQLSPSLFFSDPCTRINFSPFQTILGFFLPAAHHVVWFSPLLDQQLRDHAPNSKTARLWVHGWRISSQ